MRIVAPLAHPDEIPMLVANGADEFFAGFIPPDWIEKYGWGLQAVSRRLTATANLLTWDDFRRTVADVHAQGARIHLTLNAPQYSAETVHAVEELVEGTEDAGVDGFIVADPEMILRLRKLGVRGHIHVSSVAAARNREALALFLDMEVDRIILPRQVTMDDVRALRAAAPGVELEAFVINDTCVFDEAMCFTSHACSGPVLCRRPYTMEPVEAVTGEPVDEETRVAWMAHAEDWGKWLGATEKSGFSPGQVPEGPCGLCAIPVLAEIGVDVLKVVGREANPLRKLRSVQSVRAVLDRVRAGDSCGSTVLQAMEIRRTPEACAIGYQCYYRDVHHDHVLPAIESRT